MKGRGRAAFNQTNGEAVSKATLRDRVGTFMGFPERVDAILNKTEQSRSNVRERFAVKPQIHTDV